MRGYPENSQTRAPRGNRPSGGTGGTARSVGLAGLMGFLTGGGPGGALEAMVGEAFTGGAIAAGSAAAIARPAIRGLRALGYLGMAISAWQIYEQMRPLWTNLGFGGQSTSGFCSTGFIGSLCAIPGPFRVWRPALTTCVSPIANQAQSMSATSRSPGAAGSWIGGIWHPAACVGGAPDTLNVQWQFVIGGSAPDLTYAPDRPVGNYYTGRNRTDERARVPPGYMPAWDAAMPEAYAGAGRPAIIPWSAIPHAPSLPGSHQTRTTQYDYDHSPTIGSAIRVTLDIHSEAPSTIRTEVSPRVNARAVSQTAEQKQRPPRGVQAMFKLMAFQSEANDFTESLFKALPAHIQAAYGNTQLGRVLALAAHWREIDIAVAVQWLLLNELQDAAAGRSIGMQQSVSNQMDPTGKFWATWQTFGP